MHLKSIPFALLLLCSSIASFAQSSTDTLRFTTEQARIIAIKLTEGERCAELLSASEDQIASHLKLEESLTSQLIVKEQAIQLHISDTEILKDEVKHWKRRSAGTIIIASIAVGFITFISIK